MFIFVFRRRNAGRILKAIVITKDAEIDVTLVDLYQVDFVSPLVSGRNFL